MCRNEKKFSFSIGDTAYLRILEHSNAARRINRGDRDTCSPEDNSEKWVVTAIVKKLGRKYITVQYGMYNLLFDKETGIQNAGDDSPSYELFGTREDALDDIRASLLSQLIKDRFAHMCPASGSGIPLPDLEAVASILGVTVPWEKKPRYAVAHLLTCMHTHGYGTDGRAFAFSDPETAYRMVDWIRENKFQYEPDKGEQFDYDVQRTILDLNHLEMPTEQEIADYESNAAKQIQ